MITFTATNATAQIARHAVLAALSLTHLATVPSVLVTVQDASYFTHCWCEESGCANPAVASAIYIDAEDGQTEQALCAACAAPAIEWLRMSDQVDQTEDLEVHVSPTWLRDTHQLEL